MEWDKFWSDNKKILERSALRYMGVMKDDFLTIHLNNVQEGTIAVPNHPKVRLREGCERRTSRWARAPL